MTTAPAVSRPALVGWLVGHTRALLPTLTISVVARVANQLLGVLLLVLVAGALGDAAAGQPVDLLSLALWLVAVSLAKALLRYLEHYAGHWVAFTALARLRELFFARLVPQAPAATQGRAGAELTDRATRDIDRIEVFFAHTLPPAIAAVVVPAVALGWLGTAVDGQLAAVLVPFVVAVVLVIPLASSRSTWRTAGAVAAQRGALAARLGDDLQGVREILGFGIRQARLDGLDAADRALTEARLRSGRVQAARAAALVLLEAGGLVAVVALAAAAELPAAQALVALAVAVGLWGPARGVDDFVAGLDTAFAAAARVREVVEATPLVRDPAPSESPTPADGTPALAFEGVGFSYPGTAVPVLTDVSFTVAPGEHACIVGVSGSGKSTLAGLLLRGWDAGSGSVRLEGTDVRRLALDELRRRVAFVGQHPTLLSGTLADNLRLAAPGASDDEVRAAVAAVGLDSWVGSLPEGLQTPVAERGLSVSGGQLQRLALARALVGRPDVLVLDEALSQLDAATAALVRQRLAVHRPGLTTLEITHRADLIDNAATALVLDAGRVVEAGAAGELRAAAGAFARLEAR